MNKYVSGDSIIKQASETDLFILISIFANFIQIFSLSKINKNIDKSDLQIYLQRQTIALIEEIEDLRKANDKQNREIIEQNVEIINQNIKILEQNKEIINLLSGKK